MLVKISKKMNLEIMTILLGVNMGARCLSRMGICYSPSPYSYLLSPSGNEVLVSVRAASNPAFLRETGEFGTMIKTKQICLTQK